MKTKLWLLAVLVLGLAKGQEPSKSNKKDKKEKTYDEIITDKAVTTKGLFSVHNLDEKYYYEISDSLLDREMLMVTRIAKTANGLGFGGGKQNTQVVRWVKKKKEDSIESSFF